MKNIYWNGNGKCQNQLNIYDGLKPNIGITLNKYMNLFITTSNVYYDVHKNDGCNLLTYYDEKIKKYIMPFANDIHSLSLNVQMDLLIKNFKNKNQLEEFMDEVILYLQDKDLNYKKYSVFSHYQNKELCKEAKEGFQEISFGNENNYNNWVNHRVTNMQYVFVK